MWLDVIHVLHLTKRCVMATATAALRIPEDIANRYDRLGKSTGRTKNFYMAEAIAADCHGAAIR